MPVTSFTVVDFHPFPWVVNDADVATPYELMRARVRIAVDPDAPDNRGIPDLQFAPRSPAGLVEAESDLVVLRPSDPGKANGCVLTIVPNRGALGALPFSTGVPANPQPLAAGDAFLLRHGWSVAWIGWQWDIHRDGALLGCTVPEALDDQGEPLRGWTSLRIEPTRRLRHHPLNEPTVGWTHETPAFTTGVYRTVDVDDPAASLGVEALDGARWEIPRSEWRFARDDGDGPRTSDGHVWVDGGFTPGLCYELTYRTRTCPVVGMGMLAVRDVAAFLRYGSSGEGNPLSDLDTPRFFAHGGSQSGRFLLEYLRTTPNRDDGGRPVFDLVYPLVSGSNRGQFAQRFGKPGAVIGHDFGEATPHAIGRPDGILARQPCTPPKVVVVNSGTEYWRGDAGHLHLSTDGTRDLPDDPAVRLYLIAGTDHTGGRAGPVAGRIASRNRVDPTLVWRAILELARRWVVEDVPPPASRIPRITDGTAVTREEVLERFAGIPGALRADELPQRYEALLGRQAGLGIVNVPVGRGAAHVVLVSAVDESLNEVAGIRLPEVQIPLAVYTPWSSPADLGSARVLAGFFGSCFPLHTDVHRGGSERLAALREAAAALVSEGFLLAEDEEAAVARAAAAPTGGDDAVAWSPSTSAATSTGLS